MQNRIDALEADNLFDSNFLVEDPDDVDIEQGPGVNKDGGYAAEYVVDEVDESEDISGDEDVPQMPDSKAKAKRKEKEKKKLKAAQKKQL